MEQAKGPTEVEAALQQVSRMTARIGRVEGHVILATLEGLVEAAQGARHTEASFWAKALEKVRHFESRSSKESFHQLVISLFGSQEDKRLSSALNSWHKMVRAEEGKDKPSAGRTQEAQAPAPAPMPAPVQMPYYQPFYAPPPPPHHPPPSYGYGRFKKAMSPRTKRYPPLRAGEQCYNCGQEGHRKAECRAPKGPK